MQHHTIIGGECTVGEHLTQIFDENMITLEYFRGIIINGVMGLGAGVGIIIMSAWFKNPKLGKKGTLYERKINILSHFENKY